MIERAGVFAALAATLHYTERGVTPRYIPFEVYRDMNIQELNLQADSVAFLLDYSGPDGFPQQLAQHVSQVRPYDWGSQFFDEWLHTDVGEAVFLPF